PFKRLGTIKDLSKYVNENDIDQVWIAFPFKGEGRGKEVLDELRHSTVNIRYILDLNAFKDTEKTLTDFGGIPLLDIDVTPLEGMAAYIKLIEDKILSAFALTILSPIFLIIAIGVKLSSPGPVFYRQERISWNNKPFMMLKFRSMPVDSEKGGVSWGGAKNKQPTSFGSFLRKTSLDELPQFINVLKGDMSIIGPRPERPVFVNQFKDEIPEYMKKHMVKAGITGWAQVNGLRGDTDLKKRIEYDLFYIRHWSLGFDIKIAFQTIFKGFINKNAY
ncbi:MAG TPA: exopolysaccharide biosynthesis polyprenyl glycosylphosphotransferase, partial [Chromatiales bacterium]|nr:exopolysaccharide biosynthesis polyprenyl glycosylphosphotransferase [Chromatiales bacterium]